MKKLLFLFAASLLWVSCFETRTVLDPLSSTSISAGNPTGLTIWFSYASTPVAITGEVDLYAATQIPVPGFRTKPLASIPLTQAKEILVDTNVFQSIPDSLWPANAKQGDSIYWFNAEVMDEKLGGIKVGLGYLFKSRKFVLRGANSLLDSAMDSKSVAMQMTKLIDYSAEIDTSKGGFSKLWNYFAYIPGSHFYSLISDARFSFHEIPEGSHDCVIVITPGKEHQLSGFDSTSIYAFTKPFSTSDSGYEMGGIKERIALPDSLRTK